MNTNSGFFSGILKHMPASGKAKASSESKPSFFSRMLGTKRKKYVPGVGEVESVYMFGIRRMAVMETVVFLSVLVLWNTIMGDGNRYLDTSPHPFTLIVLLVTVQYGVSEGLMSALIASLFLLVGNLPDQQITETVYDFIYRLTFWPFIWFSTAIILGQIAQRHIAAKRSMEKKVTLVEKREDTISSAYNNLKDIKEMLESRIASQMRSTIRAYDAIKSIEVLNQSRILMGVEDVVVASMDPQKFSIYTYGEEGFQAATCVGWGDEEPYERRFERDSDLFNYIIQEKRVICIINEDDAAMLGNQGVLAAPLVVPSTGEIFGLLKIEELDFMELTLSNVESFRVLCEWIGLAYENAGEYQKARDNGMYNLDNNLPAFRLFQYELEILMGLADQTNMVSSYVKMRLSNNREFTNQERMGLGEALNQFVEEKMPKSVKLFNGRQLGAGYMLLMPGSSVEEADKQVQDMQKQMETDSNPLLQKAKFKFKDYLIDAESIKAAAE